MYFSEQGNVDDDATFITIFLVSFYLQSCCLMQSVVCGLQSLVCSLQMSHTEKKNRGFGVLLLGWGFFDKNWGIGVTLSELSAWTST